MTPTTDNPTPSALPSHVSGLRRVLYMVLGLFFVGLAILGVLLPVLPTTPFLLLASFFFVRSSPRLNRWLLRSRVFGPFLRDWQRHRGVRPRVKIVALTLLPLAIGSSIYFGNLSWPLVAMLLVLGLIGMIVVIRLPLIRSDTPPSPLPEDAPSEAPSGQPGPLAAEPLQRQKT